MTMTIEEKAKAYDEALERARKMLNMILDNELIGFPDQIREIFPQLCESMDERVRMALVEHFAPPVPFATVRGIPVQKVRDWLEKQKERNPINHNLTTWHRDVVYCAMCDENLDEGLRCNLEMVYKTIKELVDRAPVIREQKPADDKAFEKWLDDWYQGSKEAGGDVVMSEAEFKNWSRGIRNMYQQKPVECIEFDNEFEKQVSHLLASVLNGEWEYDEGFVKHAAQSLLGYAKNEMKPDEWDKREKLFRKALQAANARIGQLFEENRKLKEQKPTEWSEEDSLHLTNAILSAEKEWGNESCTAKWLKSLPERFNLQPKQEWTEEDKTNGWKEANLERYLSCLQKLGTGDPQQPETVNSKWFKEHCQPCMVSVKDAVKFGNLEYERGIKDGIQSEKSRQWRPSEEQIRAVFDASERNDKLGSVLRNLYGDLRKL